MKVIYADTKVQRQCTDIREARKLLGGQIAIAESLLLRIHMIEHAEVIRDIIMMPPLHFHKLTGDKEGYFAIDVKNRRDPWRVILQPLDEDERPYVPCHIDEIAAAVKIVEIIQVSKHYE